MEAKEPRFKTKVHSANSIHTKLQQMQTDDGKRKLMSGWQLWKGTWG